MSRYASHIVEYNENGKWVPLTFYRKGKKSMKEMPVRSFLSSMSKVLSFVVTYRKRKKAFGETELNLLKDVKYFYRAINGYSDSPKLNVINLGSDNVLREDMILSFTDLRIRDYILSEPDDIMIGRGYPKDMNKLTKKIYRLL